MKFSHIFFACLLITGAAAARSKNISLAEALKTGIINLKATATGGASYGEGLLLDIENKGKKPLDLFIEPGLIFTSPDTAAPPLLLEGGLHIILQPAARESRALQTFAYGTAAVNPAKDIAYHYKGQADSSVLKTLAYTTAHHTPAALAQKAVWTWTGHKGLHTVYEPSDNPASRNLMVFLASATHQGLPVYYSYFELNGSAKEPVLAQKPLRIYATVKWTQPAAANMTLAVYDEKEVVVQTFFEQQAFQPGHYEFNARFESAKVAAGHYRIRLSSATGVLAEMPVTID